MSVLIALALQLVFPVGYFAITVVVTGLFIYDIIHASPAIPTRILWAVYYTENGDYYEILKWSGDVNRYSQRRIIKITLIAIITR
jgi:hypothetical protein